MNIKNYSILTKKFNLLISSLHALYRLTTIALNEEELIKRLVRLIAQLLDSSFASIAILDENRTHYLIKAFTAGGTKFKIVKKQKITNKEELSLVKKMVFVFKDFYCVAPIFSEDVSGLIAVKRLGRNKEPFNATDRQILTTFSEQATIAINNARLYENQNKLILGTIKTMSTILDTKTEYAYKHTACFPRIVLAIAQKMRLDEQEMQSLYCASLLHDAGKVNIPLKILVKRKKLTGKEFDIIKAHPIDGARIIKNLKGIEPAVPIVLHHHERYDGTGYPAGLKKDQIPMGARIMALADAFEALVFGRPYKQSQPIAYAIEEIKKNSGTQFDPAVTQAFLSIINRKDIINLINKSIKR